MRKFLRRLESPVWLTVGAVLGLMLGSVFGRPILEFLGGLGTPVRLLWGVVLGSILTSLYYRYKLSSETKERDLKQFEPLGISELIHKRAEKMQLWMVRFTVWLGVPIALAIVVYLYIALFRDYPAAPMEVAPLIAGAITRIGAVIVTVYILMVLANFTRYGFRVADHLHATADALALAGKDHEKLASFVDALSPRHILFEKFPKGSSDKVAAEMVKRVSTS